MRRLLAGLCLIPLLVIAVQAAGPPTRQDDPTRPSERFTMGTPKSLADLRRLEERVQWTIKRVMPSVVGFGGGSAVIVSKEGMALTVAHVGGKSGRDATFIFPDGKRAKGKTLGNWAGVDAGMAKITDKGEFPFTPMGKSSELKVGQWVVTMGFPISFSKGMKPPVRVGRIVSLSATTIVTDCPMMGGDSGGPIFNLDGEVIGQNSRTANNYNVHVPVDVYRDNWKRMLAGEDWGGSPFGKGKGKKGKDEKKDEKKEKGKSSLDGDEEGCAAPPQKAAKAAPPVKGKERPPVRVGPNERLHESVKAAFREATQPHAECVARVFSDGKACALATVVGPDGLLVTKATQLKGKITVRLSDGRTLDAEKLGEDKEGDLAVLRVQAKGLKPALWREGIPEQGRLIAAVGEKGEPITLGTVTSEPRKFALAERPTGPAPKGGRPFLGVGVDDVENGAKLNNVAAGSPADKAGLKAGDIVKKLGDHVVKDLAALRAALDKYKVGDKVPVLIERNGKEEKFETTLGAAPALPAGGLPYDRWGGGPFSERRFGFGKVLPTDAYLNPADCGGPVVDTSGRVVGVTVSRALRISTFVLPADDVKRIVAKAAEKK